MEKLESNILDFSALDSWTDYKLLECVGTGAYSTVWEAKYLPTNSIVAIKIEEVEFADIVTCKRILREIKLLRKLKHPNIVKLIEVFMGSKDNTRMEVYVVMELIDTDLKQLLKSPSYLSEKQIKTIFYNTLLAMKYLRSAEVMHRDIKPANILITKQCQAKLCDFGLGRTMYELNPLTKNTHPETTNASPEPKTSTEIPTAEQNKPYDRSKRLTMYVVTRWYRAPELVLMQDDYAYKVDVWALGCLFAELQGMKKENCANCKDRSALFPGKVEQLMWENDCGLAEENNIQLAAICDVMGTPTKEDCEFITDTSLTDKLLKLPKKDKKSFEEMYPGSEKTAIDLLDKMLQFNPNKRIDIDKCLEHPYLSSVRNKTCEISATHKISLEFPPDEDLNETVIRKMFVEEVEYFEKLKKAGKLFNE
jgi:mitogen-activated protein kinase 1/3